MVIVVFLDRRSPHGDAFSLLLAASGTKAVALFRGKEIHIDPTNRSATPSFISDRCPNPALRPPKIPLDIAARRPPIARVKKPPPFTFRAPCRLAGLVAAIGLGVLGCGDGGNSVADSQRADEAFAAGDHNRAEIACKNLLKQEPDSRPALRMLGKIWLERGSPRIAAGYFTKLCQLDPKHADDRASLSAAILFSGDRRAALAEARKALDLEPAHQLSVFVMAVASTGAEQQSEAEARLARIGEGVGGSALPLAKAVFAIRRGDLESARSLLGLAEKIDPEDPKVQVWKAEWHRAAKEEDAAEACLKEAVRLAPTRSPERIALATYLQVRGKRDEALGFLHSCVQEAPDFIAAWRMIAADAMARGNNEEAKKALGSVFAKDALDFESVVLQSRLWLSDGSPEKIARAVAMLERLEKAYPHSPALALELAKAHDSAKNPAAAVRSLDRALKIAPDYREALLMKARLEMAAGDDSAAIASLSAWMEKHPEDGEAGLSLARALRKNGRTGQGIDLLRPLATRNKAPGELRFQYGLLLLDAGRPGEARGAFERILEDFPADQSASTELVKLDMAANRKAEALGRAMQQVRDHPESPGALHLKAAVLADSGHWDEADEALRGALALEPDHPGANELMARIRAETGRVEEAKRHWEKVRAGSPGNPEPSMELAALHESLGETGEARSRYEEILATHPDHVPALTRLAGIHAEEDASKLPRARELAEKARALAPDDPETAEALGWILWKQGDLAQAAKLLAEAVKGEGNQPGAQFRFGMVKRALGDEAGAIAAFRLALSTGGEFPGRADAIAALEALETPVEPGEAGMAELSARMERDPRDVVTGMKLAAAFESVGRHARAAETCAAVLKVNPELLDAHRMLARLHVGPLEDEAKASTHALKVRELDPDDAWAASVLGTLAYRKGDYARAAPLLRESLGSIRGDLALSSMAARAAYRTGESDQAVSLMEEALRQGGDPVAESRERRFLALVTGRASAGEIAEALADDPDDIAALMARGSLAEKNGKREAALADYSKARLLDPFFPQAREAAARLTAMESRR